MPGFVPERDCQSEILATQSARVYPERMLEVLPDRMMPEYLPGKNAKIYAK